MTPATRSRRGLLQSVDPNTLQGNHGLRDDSSKGKANHPPKKTRKPAPEPPALVAEAKPRVFHQEDFEVLETLGEGAQSVVVKALDKLVTRFCAIKMIDYKHHSKYADRELALHASLENQHEGIVHFYGHYFSPPLEGVKDAPRKLCLVLEHCPTTLLALVKKKDRLEESQAAQLLLQLVNVLEFLHLQKGIMHRDIKLANILLTEDPPHGNKNNWKVKLCDFGVATKAPLARRNPKDRRTIVGTSGYMAPEIEENADRTAAGQALYEEAQKTGNYNYAAVPLGVDLMDSHYNTLVDIYALGVTMHATVTGIIPGEEDDSDFDLCFGGVDMVPEIPGYLSSACIDLLEGLLEEDPSRRLTLQQIKSHPWLMEHINQDS